MTAFSCTYWINMLYSIITMFFSFHFSKVIGFILSIIISTIIYTLLLMIFYNHKEQWSNISIKIFVILLIIGAMTFLYFTMVPQYYYIDHEGYKGGAIV